MILANIEFRVSCFPKGLYKRLLSSQLSLSHQSHDTMAPNKTLESIEKKLQNINFQVKRYPTKTTSAKVLSGGPLHCPCLELSLNCLRNDPEADAVDVLLVLDLDRRVRLCPVIDPLLPTTKVPFLVNIDIAFFVVNMVTIRQHNISVFPQPCFVLKPKVWLFCNNVISKAIRYVNVYTRCFFQNILRVKSLIMPSV